MSKPEDHLVRTAAVAGDELALSALTGLARLDLKMHRLAGGEVLHSAAGCERFLYVLAGSGALETETDSAALSAGDFAALTADESATLHSEQNLSVLLGQSGHSRT